METETRGHYQSLIDLLEDTSELSILTDLEGRIFNTNLTQLDGFDYTMNALLNMTIFDLIPENHINEARAYLDKVIRFGKARGTIVIENKNRKQFYLASNSAAYIGRERQQTRLLVTRATDITQQILAEKALKQSMQYLNDFMENYPYAIEIKEIGGKYLWGNHCWKQSAKTRNGVVSMDNYLKQMDTKQADIQEIEDIEILQEGKAKTYHKKSFEKGMLSHFSQTKFPIRDNNNHIFARGNISLDITEQVETQNRLDKLLLTDPLTGLPNRKSFFETVLQEQTRKAVLIIDLDRFKNINSTYGREVGDELIKMVARKINFLINGNHFLTRLEGAEFALIFDYIEKNSVIALTQRIIKEISNTYVINDLNLHVSVSIGVAYYPENGNSISSLLKKANIAMSVISSYGNEYRVFNQTMYQEIHRRNKIINDLRHAIQHDFNQMKVYYQPIVDNSENPVGAEALIRWNHPEEGMIPPDEFIPLAEETGLIVQLTRLIVEEVCIKLKKWGSGSPYVSVNISTLDLMESDFIKQIFEILERHNLDKKRIKFEITETHVMNNPDKAFKVIDELNQLGIQLFIDDFGTGHSSLSHLMRFPKGTTLKIDQSFIKNLSLNQKHLDLVETIIKLAGACEMKVVMEGVESSKHASLLKNFGSNMMQGYAFSRPLPSSEFEDNYINN